MLWEKEVAERGIVWAALWDNPFLRQITSSLRVVVWSILQPQIVSTQDNAKTSSTEVDYSDLIRRTATPPRIPSLKQSQSTLMKYMTNIFGGW
jgi:hypothetical protein